MTLRTLRMLFRHDLFRLGALMLIGIASASASVIGIYGGIDTGSGPGGPFSYGLAAQSQFWAAIGYTGPADITFEGLTSLSNVGPGVTIALNNADPMSGLETTNNPAGIPPGQLAGFNVTSGGHEWLMLAPQPNLPTPGANITFTFDSAITAFGVWFTGTQSGLPGPLSIWFDGGAAGEHDVVKTDDKGGTIFVGLVTDVPFTTVTIDSGATTGYLDIWGIDDVTFGGGSENPSDIPEPSTVSLFIGALLVAVSLKLRARTLRSLPVSSTATGRNRA